MSVVMALILGTASTGILGRMSSSTGDSSRDMARVEKELLARWPESRLEPSLTRITALVDLLGSPHRAMPVVQVAGTNGKTTTARMIDELLRGFGLRIGRFTSPHLESIRDRKSTRLNSSHANISYAVFCLKKNIFCISNHF